MNAYKNIKEAIDVLYEIRDKALRDDQSRLNIYEIRRGSLNGKYIS